MRKDIRKVKGFVKKNLPDWFIKHHVKLVVAHSKWLCSFYPEADEEVVEIAAWLHDIVHPVGGYKGRAHEVASAKEAEEFLNSINMSKEKISKIVHCIKTHRTRKPPEPKTIEAKIVASADNMAHFGRFELLVKILGLEKALQKLRRDLEASFMLPEAREYAEKKMREIERKLKKLK